MTETLAGWTSDARARTLALAGALTPDQLLGPRLAIVNPPLWELGHIAWFQERWVLRHAAGMPPLRRDGDVLYDSAAIPHDTRWSLPLPSLEETVGYLREVEARVLALIGRVAADQYFVRLAVFHEDMHFEAMAFTRQTLGYAPAPARPGAEEPPVAGADLPGDVEVPGGTFRLGAEHGDGFVFDNEKWAHPVELAPFRIARAPVTQAHLAEFVDDGGYRRRELWSPAGWQWREAVGAFPAGESAFGCRQLIGNVWEWTASDFLPYPGFVPDPYREYSQPWFGTHKVLRGGSFATPARLLRNTWRNFYTPDRRDPWAGFRTCAA